MIELVIILERILADIDESFGMFSTSMITMVIMRMVDIDIDITAVNIYY